MIRLSRKELQILHQLESNARQSLSAIAKKCRMSKESANYYIKKLEREGAIKEYFTLIDRSRLGLTTHRLYIKQRKLDPEVGKGIVRFLKSRPDVWAFGETSSEFDFAVGVSTRDRYEFGDFVEELLNRFGKDILWLETQMMLDYTEYTREYLTAESKKTMKTLASKETVKHDSIDLKILGELRKDARIPFSKIANRLGLSERIVRYRVKRMEKMGIIVAYRCNTDYRKLGYDYYKIDLFLEDRTNIEKIRNFVNALPQTVYSEKTVYYSDIEFDIEVRGTEELLETVQRIAKKFPGALREFKYYTMLRFYK